MELDKQATTVEQRARIKQGLPANPKVPLRKIRRLGPRKPPVNLVGRRFNKLLVTGESSRYAHLKALCDCGKKVEISKYRLLRPKPQASCGCFRAAHPRASQYQPGVAFGAIELVERLTPRGRWLCRCRVCEQPCTFSIPFLRRRIFCPLEHCGCLKGKPRTRRQYRRYEVGLQIGPLVLESLSSRSTAKFPAYWMCRCTHCQKVDEYNVYTIHRKPRPQRCCDALTEPAPP